MRKIFSLSFIILIFCFSTTVFGANEVSWSSFVEAIDNKYSIDLENTNGTALEDLKSNFSSWNSFILLNNFTYTTTPVEGNFIYIIGSYLTDNRLVITEFNNSEIKFRANGGISSSALNAYRLNLDTDTLEISSSPYLVYNIVSFPQYTVEKWKTLAAVDYMVQNSVLGGYNTVIYNSNSSSITHIFDTFDIGSNDDNSNNTDGSEDTDVNSSGDGGAFIPPSSGRVAYFVNYPKGYLTSPNYSKVSIFLPNDWQFDDVYLMLGKYSLDGSLLESSLIQCYSNSSQDNIIWSKDDTGFYSCFLSDWYDFDTSSEVYYAVNLFSFELGFLDASTAFYFNYNLVPDNSGFNEPNLGFDTGSIDSIVNSTKSWVNSLFGFLDIFPAWLNALIGCGLAVVIVLRVLGR